jgi:hypothetical protein
MILLGSNSITPIDNHPVRISSTLDSKAENTACHRQGLSLLNCNSRVIARRKSKALVTRQKQIPDNIDLLTLLTRR